MYLCTGTAATLKIIFSLLLDPRSEVLLAICYLKGIVLHICLQCVNRTGVLSLHTFMGPPMYFISQHIVTQSSWSIARTDFNIGIVQSQYM